MIGVCFYFGFDLPPEQKAKMIKDNGFDCVITNADKKWDCQNGSFRSQIKLFRKYGLKPSSLHMRYHDENLKLFWEEGRAGRRLERRLKKDLWLASRYNFSCVVTHISGKYSEVGKKRLERILSFCKKVNVPIAIENTRNRVLFEKVFQNIKNDYLKFCYDSGHNNCFDKGFDYFSKYGDKLVALHLHDNMGKKDDHTLNSLGTIDWDKIAKELAKLPPVSLDYEILMVEKGKFNAEETLKTCIKQGRELQEKIDKYRVLYNSDEKSSL